MQRTAKTGAICELGSSPRLQAIFQKGKNKLAKKAQKENKESTEENNLLTTEIKDEINKSANDEIAFLVSDESPSDVKVFIPTGATMLDICMANRYPGGVPVGRITEFSGLEGCVTEDTIVEVIIE